MNKEIKKAIQKSQASHLFRDKWDKWWSAHSAQVLKIVFFPFWVGDQLIKKHKQSLEARAIWSEAHADQVLNYYLARRAEWNVNTQSFFYFNNGMGWDWAFAKKYIKRKDRYFWEVNTCHNGGKIQNYLIDNFELEGFQKVVGYCDHNTGWTEITFILQKPEIDA